METLQWVRDNGVFYNARKDDGTGLQYHIELTVPHLNLRTYCVEITVYYPGEEPRIHREFAYFVPPVNTLEGAKTFAEQQFRECLEDLENLHTA